MPVQIAIAKGALSPVQVESATAIDSSQRLSSNGSLTALSQVEPTTVIDVFGKTANAVAGKSRQRAVREP